MKWNFPNKNDSIWIQTSFKTYENGKTKENTQNNKIKAFSPFFFLRFILHERDAYTHTYGSSIHHPLVQSHSGCIIWSWTSVKLKAKSFFWISYMCAGLHGLGPSSLLSQAISREVEQPDTTYTYCMLVIYLNAL